MTRSTDPLPAPILAMPTCGGTFLLAIPRVVPKGIAYRTCPGCLDCAVGREPARVERLAVTPPAADPFAGIPTDNDERF